LWRGIKIGSDALTRKKLDGGKKGNPRVAQSQRGKDLRLAAAEARMKSSSKAVNPVPVATITVDDDDGYDGGDDDVVFIGEFEKEDFEPLHRFEDEELDIRDLLAKEMKELNLDLKDLKSGKSTFKPGYSSCCAIVID
jgi:hypothetical protein